MTTPEFVTAAAAFVFITLFGEGLVAFLGYCVFSILTLGQVRLRGPADKDLKFPWHGFARGSNGRLVVDDQVATGIGVAFLLFCFVIYALWRNGVFAFA